MVYLKKFSLVSEILKIKFYVVKIEHIFIPNIYLEYFQKKEFKDIKFSDVTIFMVVMVRLNQLF